MKDNLTARGVTLLLSDHLLDKLDKHVEQLKKTYRRDPKVLQDVFDRQPSRVSVAAHLLSRALSDDKIVQELYP